MSKKSSLKDVQIIRSYRKEAQKKAQDEKLRLQKKAQERRDALDKERLLRREATQLESVKFKKHNRGLQKILQLTDSNASLYPGEIAFERIREKLPASPKEIAQILDHDISDRYSDEGKEKRAIFARLIRDMVDNGHIKEQNGKYIDATVKLSVVSKRSKKPQSKNTFNVSSELKGVIHVLKNKVVFEPLDGDITAMDMKSDMGMVDGNIVTVQLTDDFACVSNILDVHGNMEEGNALGKLSALSAGIPLKFPDDVLSDTPSLRVPSVSGYRKDFRKVPFITIDPVDAKDFDDAICVRRTTKGWRVMVAIADVSHYIKPGTKLAIEAHKRGNSTYLPDMVVPMLPEELSNGVCSLRPNEDRACMVCTMDIDKQGNITSKKFERGLMKSRMRLNYDQVQDAIDGDRKKLPRNAWGYIEKALEVYNARLKDKKRRGALQINSAEQRISIGKSRDLSLALEVGNEAHGIIEELMIAANVATAEILNEKADKTIKRVHGTPKEEIYSEFREQLEELGIHPPKSGDLKNRILSIIGQIPKCSDPDLAYVLVTRMQDMAVYSTEDLEHFGLGLKHYTHETSPIRRASDWYIHCQLNEVLNLQGGYTLSSSMKANMTKSADHFSRRERISQSAERECQRRYMAMWVKRNLSGVFQGHVTSVNNNHVWVKVENEGVAIKTAIKKADLPKAIYNYNNGDEIYLQPVKANTVTGVIEFKGANPRP